MSSISAMAASMMVGTKNTWVTPWACTASAKYRLPVMRGMGASSSRRILHSDLDRRRVREYQARSTYRGGAHDLRSPDLFAAHGSGGRVRGALRQAQAAAGKALEARRLLAHRLRPAQPGRPRLALRQPAAPHRGARGDGERRRAQPAARRTGFDRGAAVRHHDPRPLHAAAWQPQLRQRELLRDAHLHLRARRPAQGAGGVGQGRARSREALASGRVLDERDRGTEQVRPRVGLQGLERARADPGRIAEGRPVAAPVRGAPGAAGEQAPDPRVVLAAAVVDRDAKWGAWGARSGPPVYI